jgi:predicted NUDIX family NTP pyrophosphohydrolase
VAIKTSAGLLLYRRVGSSRGGDIEVLLAHPGGPYFRNKDDGAWSLPKGELALDEEPLACAVREFREETGIDPGAAELVPLGEIRQKGGKRVLAWAFDGGALALDCTLPPPSNTFELEWPPRSGKRQLFPEIDRMQLFELAAARVKILPAQSELLSRLEALLEH